jgi:3-hydroxypropanoate dehydrogenase
MDQPTARAADVVSPASLDQIFRRARTFRSFSDRPVADKTLHELYDLVKWGPTAFNAQPARYVFVKSASAKARLRAALLPGNVEPATSAPVTVIVAWDTRFQDHLPALCPGIDARRIFDADPPLAHETRFRNATLQGAYLILAARALGLDAGPMSGFDPDLVDEIFFRHGRWCANLLVNLGYGEPGSLGERGPRLSFREVARIV